MWTLLAISLWWRQLNEFPGGKSFVRSYYVHVIVELRRGEPNEWRIVMNSAMAVDQILEGGYYSSQRRTRDPATGEFSLELEKA